MRFRPSPSRALLVIKTLPPGGSGPARSLADTRDSPWDRQPWDPTAQRGREAAGPGSGQI